MTASIAAWGLLHLLGLAGALGLGATATAFVLSKLKTVDAHTKSALLNKIIDAIGNAAEDVVKAVLTHTDIDAILTALAGGTPIESVLKGLLPAMLTQVQSAIGPALGSILTALLGGDTAANTRISQSIISAVHDLALAHKAASNTDVTATDKKVIQLQSGHLLVMPYNQKIPAGSTVVHDSSQVQAA